MHRRTLLLCLLAPGAQALASEATAVDPARRVAGDWLALVDRGDFTASWAQASATFKATVTAAQWQQAAAGARTPLGTLAQRAERSARATTSLPGVPDGRYVVLQYQSSFERKAAATETVTVQFDADGAWRVAGYFVR